MNKLKSQSPAIHQTWCAAPCLTAVPIAIMRIQAVTPAPVQHPSWIDRVFLIKMVCRQELLIGSMITEVALSVLAWGPDIDQEDAELQSRKHDYLKMVPSKSGTILSTSLVNWRTKFNSMAPVVRNSLVTSIQILKHRMKKILIWNSAQRNILVISVYVPPWKLTLLLSIDFMKI